MPKGSDKETEMTLTGFFWYYFEQDELNIIPCF